MRITIIKAVFFMIPLFSVFEGMGQHVKIFSNGVISTVEIRFYSLEEIGTSSGSIKPSEIDSIQFKQREEKDSPLYATLDKLEIHYSFTESPLKIQRSLKSRDKEVQEIKLALEEFRVQRNTGYTITALGIILSSAGVLFSGSNIHRAKPFFYAGAVAVTSGFIIIWTSGNKLRIK